ncbi:mucin-5AC [Xyrauchen texanus]|uniref:mucin-5AC n=1 Tax=Xyrauchen texanus TaxID=154827 RepID=UPI002241B457|nr:mucin-5AC [Xyrauchen texanus]
MRLAFSNLLLSLALGLCFMFIHAQEQNETDTNATTTLLNKENVDTTLSPQGTIEVTPENIVTELPMTPDPDYLVSTLDHQMTTIHEVKSTVEASTPLITDTEQTTTQTTQTTPRSVSEGITAQGQHTTMALESMEASTTTVPVSIKKGGTAPITSEYLTSTGSYETTVGFTTSELTSATKHRDDLTTAMVALTPASTVLSSTPTTLKPLAEGTEPPPIMSSPEDTTFLTVTTKTSTRISHDILELPHSQLEDDSVSTHLTPTTIGGYVKHSILPTQISWLLILIIVLSVIILCVLLVALLMFVQRRKKIASRKFGPGYVNGQNKRSMKKKGAEDDAWAGPVNLEAGDKVECDGVVQGGLLSDEGREDGDDLVLSTFAAIESGDTPIGGVGGEGTKEVKKWEEQEPLLYIDENVEEDNKEKAVAEKQRQKGDENNGQLAVREIKDLNGGETFCLTTAV